MKVKKALCPWMLLLPTLFIFITVTAGPLGYLFWVSFFKYDFAIKEFVGFGNFLRGFQDWRFFHSLVRTSLFIGVGVSIQFFCGFLIALYLTINWGYLNYIRTLIIIPMMLTPVAIAILWKLLYNPEIGVINYFVSIFGFQKVQWLGDYRLALFSIIIVDIWQWLPFFILIFTAGLHSIPEQIIEAAKVDGATYWQRVRCIKLPLLKNIIFIALTLRSIDAFRTFDKIYIMTRGGPALASSVYSVYLYQVAFRYFKIDHAAVLSIFGLIVAVITCTVFFRIGKFEI